MKGSVGKGGKSCLFNFLHDLPKVTKVERTTSAIMGRLFIERIVIAFVIVDRFKELALLATAEERQLQLGSSIFEQGLSSRRDQEEKRGGK